MAAKSKSTGSARTEPKGRATTPRGARVGRRRFITPAMEWILAILLFLAVLAVIFLVFGDARSDTTGTPVGSPAPVVALAPPT